jgi:hypothetical protein
MTTEEIKEEIINIIKNTYDYCKDNPNDMLSTPDERESSIMEKLSTQTEKELNSSLERFRKNQTMVAKYKMSGVKLVMCLTGYNNGWLVTSLEDIKVSGINGQTSFILDSGLLENGNFQIGVIPIMNILGSGIGIDVSALNFKIQSIDTLCEIYQLMENKSSHSRFLRIDDKGFVGLVKEIYGRYVLNDNQEIEKYKQLLDMARIVRIKEKKLNNGGVTTNVNYLCDLLEDNDLSYINEGQGELMKGLIQIMGKLLEIEIGSDNKIKGLIDENECNRIMDKVINAVEEICRD